MNIINCRESDLNSLYDNDALTFEGTTIDDDNLNYLIDWLKSHDCKMRCEEFYVIKGRVMNDHYQLTGDNRYPDNLNILCIRLDNLTNVNAIVAPRFELGGRWFRDVVDNNSARENNL